MVRVTTGDSRRRKNARRVAPRVATGDGRRRKNARRGAPPAAEIDIVPDEVLYLVFLRLPSYLHLVRAACVCRRWRHVIACRRWRRVKAGDDGDFLEQFASLRGPTSPHVVGCYRVDARHQHKRPPGRSPVFVPSSGQRGAVAKGNLALDFLPRKRGCYGVRCWELLDSRGGLLLLCYKYTEYIDISLLVCDPLARRFKLIPDSAWFRNCEILGAFLLDGEDAGASFSMSNFRVTCVLFSSENCIIRPCVFSSTPGGGGWFSHGGWTSHARRNSSAPGVLYFAGSNDGFAYWTAGDNIVLTLDKDAAKFTSSVLPDDEYAVLRNKRHATEYAYQQQWPPTIEACLS